MAIDPNPTTLINAFDSLKSADDQQKVIAGSLEKLDDDQTSVAVAAAAKTLPDAAKQDLVEALQSSLPPPTQNANDLIWKLIVGSFVFVFVGTSAAMAYSLLSGRD